MQAGMRRISDLCIEFRISETKSGCRNAVTSAFPQPDKKIMSEYFDKFFLF